MSPHRQRLVTYVLLGALVAFIVWRQEQSIDDLHEVIRSEEAEERVEEAQRCVSSWEVRGQIRESDERHGRAAGEALIEVVQPDDPAVVDLYRADLARHLLGASREIEDPTCDLDHARRVVANAKEQP